MNNFDLTELVRIFTAQIKQNNMKIQSLSDGLLKAYSYCSMHRIGLDCIVINRIETDLGELVER